MMLLNILALICILLKVLIGSEAQPLPPEGFDECTSADIAALNHCFETFNTTLTQLADLVGVEECSSIQDQLQLQLNTLQTCLDEVILGNLGCIVEMGDRLQEAQILISNTACEPSEAETSSSTISPVSPPIAPNPGIPGFTSCSQEVLAAMSVCQINYDNVFNSLNISYDNEVCSKIALASSTHINCLDTQLSRDANCAIERDSIMSSTPSYIKSATKLCACNGGLHAVIDRTQACLSSLSVDVYSYDNVCGLIQSYMNCMNDEFTTCPALLEIAEPILNDLLMVEALFGCTVNIAGHMYQSDSCNYHQLTECYNPLLLAVTGHEVTRTTDLATFAFGNLTDIGDERCVDIQNVPEYSDMLSCAQDKLLECYNGVNLDHSSETLALWRMEDGADLGRDVIQQIPLVSMFLVQGLDMVRNIAYTVHSLAHVINMYCDSGCSNQMEQSVAFDMCVTRYASDLNMVLDGVFLQYHLGFSGPPSNNDQCRTLVNITECMSLHLSDCQFLQQQVPDSWTRMAAALSICEVEFNFNVGDGVGMCDSAELSQRSVPVTQQSCDQVMLRATDFSFYLRTDSQICQAYQEQANCYESYALCCEAKKKLMAPLMHTWAMVSEKLSGCTISVAESLNSVIQLPLLPMAAAITSSSVSCSYDEVLTCYEDMLSLLQLSVNDLSELTAENMRKLYSIRGLIFSTPASTCPSASQLNTIESCLKNFTDKCVFPDLCVTDSIYSGSENLPLAEILWTDVKEVCSPECKYKDPISPTVFMCTQQNIAGVTATANVVMWNKYKGTSSDQQCSDLQSVADCINTNVGSCQLYKKYAVNELGGERGVIHRAMMECGIDVTASTTTTTTTTTTTQGQTTGAQQVLSSAILIFVSICLTLQL